MNSRGGGREGRGRARVSIVAQGCYTKKTKRLKQGKKPPARQPEGEEGTQLTQLVQLLDSLFRHLPISESSEREPGRSLAEPGDELNRDLCLREAGGRGDEREEGGLIGGVREVAEEDLGEEERRRENTATTRA